MERRARQAQGLGLAQRARRGPFLRPARRQPEPRVEAQVLGDGQVRRQDVVLGRKGRGEAALRRRRHGAVERHEARRRARRPPAAQHLEQRRLSRAARPQQARQAARGDLQRDLLEDDAPRLQF